MHSAGEVSFNRRAEKPIVYVDRALDSMVIACALAVFGLSIGVATIYATPLTIGFGSISSITSIAMGLWYIFAKPSWQDIYRSIPKEQKVEGRYNQYTVVWHPDSERLRSQWKGLSYPKSFDQEWKRAAPRYFCAIAAINSVRAMLRGELNNADDIDSILHISQNQYAHIVLAKRAAPRNEDNLYVQEDPWEISRGTFLTFIDYSIRMVMSDISILHRSMAQGIIPGIDRVPLDKTTRVAYNFILQKAEQSLSVNQNVGLGIGADREAYGVVVTKTGENSFRYEFADSHGDILVNDSPETSIGMHKITFFRREDLVCFLEAHYSRNGLSSGEDRLSVDCVVIR
jgi:hypothetical protein